MKRSFKLLGSAGGFTLIEVILALTIFALIGTVLFGAFTLGHRAVERSSAHFEKNQALRSFSDLIGGYIRSSYPYRTSPQDATIYYNGEREQLSFVSSYSLAMGGRGMAKVYLSWEGGDGADGVLRLEEEVPVRLNSEDGESGYRTGVVLHERVQMFELAYLDARGAEERWEERWDAAEKKALPRAVRLSYRLQSGREIRWVFPVMMTVLAQ
jgi:general secretion pathway protein J